MQAGQIFFSYSRADAAFALKLAEDLRKAGIDIWIDQIDIRPSEPWDEEIERALQESKCLLVIVSKTSVASDNVLNEINYALESKKQVLPVLLENVERKPLNISRLQHIDFTLSYETGLARLLDSLRAGGPPVAEVSQSTSKIIPTIIITGVVIILAIIASIYVNRSSNQNEKAAIADREARAADSIKIATGKLNGNWTTNEVVNPFDEHDRYVMIFTFDIEDSLILGSINFKSTNPVKGYNLKTAFLGGTIKGNNLSFYTIEQNAGFENPAYKNYYTGTYAGDSIRFMLQSDRQGRFPGLRFVGRK